MRLLVLNGPNLSRLGTRQPEIYGSESLGELESRLATRSLELGADLEARHSNHEGELIDWIHGSDHEGIVINPGALAHSSYALADAIRSIATPAVEVHISNVREREPWRARSLVAEACIRSIYGRGTRGYLDAIRHLLNREAQPFDTVRYGPHPDNVGDLRRGEAGLVVLVHGGFWRHEWERDTMESLAVDLAERGLHSWNLEYRRLGDGGGWPGSAHDVLMALDFIPQLDLGNAPISVVGHSAGGQLAAWAVERTTAPVRRLVALAPVLELSMHADSGLYGADEARALVDAGAPASLTPPTVPTLFVHGSNDSLVPLEHAGNGGGPEHEQILLADTGHFDLLDPARETWWGIADRLVASP